MLLLVLAAFNPSCSNNSELARVKAEARRGNPEAQFQLGAYYHDGLDVTRDYEAAAAWFGRAARQGYPAAQLALGTMLLNAEGMLPDEAEAANWIRKAAEQGYPPAQDELATLYAEGIGVMQDDAAAVSWATKAAEQGLPEAQYHLGSFLASGAPGGAVPPDKIASACFWLALAAADGHQESQELFNTLKRQLTQAQLNELTNRTRLWRQKHPSQE